MMWIHLCVRVCDTFISRNFMIKKIPSKFRLDLFLWCFRGFLYIFHSLSPSTAFFRISLNFWYFLLFCERKTTESQQCARIWSQENITSQFLLIMCGGHIYMQHLPNVPKGRHSTCEPVGIYSWRAVRRRSCYPSMTTLHIIALQPNTITIPDSILNPPISMFQPQLPPHQPSHPIIHNKSIQTITKQTI